MKLSFTTGLRHGIPIALGYLSVSFGIGIMAIQAGLTVADAVIISMTNLTSAGQAAGIEIIAAAGTYLEMALTQLIINLRYSLMGLTLSQKLDDSFRTPQRMIAAFGITDEVLGLAAAQKEKITPPYMYGMILIAFIGWALGTFLGAAAGNILPPALSEAMGIVLYGMFIAIVVPVAKKDRSVFWVVCLAIGCSLLLYYVFTAVTSGFAIIISAVVAAAVGAMLFPIEEEEEA